MSLVSIILPYYKKINFIKKSYFSIINQSYQNYELLIIYDDENISDLKYLVELTKDNPKVKIFKNHKNIGAGQSRNYGIEMSIGEYLSFIDADDIWDKYKLEKQVNFMKKNNYQFTFSNYFKEYPHKKLIVAVKNTLEYKDILHSCEIGLSTVMMHKSIIDKNLFLSLKTQEDFAAWLKILRTKNVKAYNINENLVTWNFDKDSLSSKTFQKLKDAFTVFKYYEKFSTLKSIFCLIVLSFNSLKRKF